MQLKAVIQLLFLMLVCLAVPSTVAAPAANGDDVQIASRVCTPRCWRNGAHGVCCQTRDCEVDCSGDH
ncbi:uncharacterized protein VTP21DRAFT_8733 [Calcarisporiella thermophila]|uniref:uncharacterized protein n=1 Tax=Calcarisporiella thermophila TaxID=911321 RepID=UPI003742EFCD